MAANAYAQDMFRNRIEDLKREKDEAKELLEQSRTSEVKSEDPRLNNELIEKANQIHELQKQNLELRKMTMQENEQLRNEMTIL